MIIQIFVLSGSSYWLRSRRPFFNDSSFSFLSSSHIEPQSQFAWRNRYGSSKYLFSLQ
nr:MAG TPA: hypothetical protein [Caudoviricetes sp.]